MTFSFSRTFIAPFGVGDRDNVNYAEQEFPARFPHLAANCDREHTCCNALAHPFRNRHSIMFDREFGGTGRCNSYLHISFPAHCKIRMQRGSYMQKAVNKDQRTLVSKTISNIGMVGNLLAVLILVACAGTNAGTSAKSLNTASHFQARESSCSARGESSKCMFAMIHETQPKKIGTESFAEAYRAVRDAPVRPSRENTDALTCLALNVYWEARNQSAAGQLAVAQVTMNRVLDPRYDDDVCDVVYDHKQFSWYWDGKSDTPTDGKAWTTAYLVASAAMNGSGHVELQDVTHYHAVYIQPYWQDYMVKVAMIGDHVFYAD
jgi:spore germination cell wall hydrolase CwlJ-like protein